MLLLLLLLLLLRTKQILANTTWMLLLAALCICTSWIAAAAFAPVYGYAGGASAARAIARTSISASQGPHKATPAASPKAHVVSGLVCTEVQISLNVKIDCGPSGLRKRIDVTVIEASSASQDTLVNSALALEGDHTPDSIPLASGDPYGAVLWPAGAAVAEHLFGGQTPLSRNALATQTLLELGAGTGLLSLAAASAGFARVIATDYERLTLDLLAYAAAHLNPDVPAGVVETAVLDLCDAAARLPPADVVVVADVLYAPATGPPLARRVIEALEAGSRVIVGDSPDRPGRASFVRELSALLPEVGVADQWVAVEARACAGHRHELICGKGSKSVSSAQASVTVSILDLSPSCLRVR